MIRWQIRMRHVPPRLSEDQQLQFNHTIGRPTMRHVTSRLWSSIAIDQTLKIASSLLCANHNPKIRFLIPKNPEKFIKNSEKIQKNP